MGARNLSGLAIPGALLRLHDFGGFWVESLRVWGLGFRVQGLRVVRGFMGAFDGGFGLMLLLGGTMGFRFL